MNTDEHEFINDKARMSNDEERRPQITRIDAKEKSRKRKSFALPAASAGKPGFSASFVFVRVDSWLRAKSQHFDRGGDFDVLVTDYEI